MNFTAKEEYGIRAALDLALHRSEAPIQIREVAVRQRIPEQFLEQLLATLRRAGVVQSTRGASGGYRLARSPDQITVGEIIRALSGPIVPLERLGEPGSNGDEYETYGVVQELWEQVRKAIEAVIDRTTLQDLVDRKLQYDSNQSYLMYI